MTLRNAKQQKVIGVAVSRAQDLWAMFLAFGQTWDGGSWHFAVLRSRPHGFDQAPGKPNVTDKVAAKRQVFLTGTVRTTELESVLCSTPGFAGASRVWMFFAVFHRFG